MTNKIIPKIADIHIGDRTHSQLQEITPVSLNTMNTIVSSPVNPIPVVALLLFFILTSPFFSYFIIFIFAIVKGHVVHRSFIK